MYIVSPLDLWIPNHGLKIIFDSPFVESTDVKLRAMEGWLYYLLKKNPHISGPTQLKLLLFKGQLSLIFNQFKGYVQNEQNDAHFKF